MIDEDEVVEVIRFGREPTLIRTGLQFAKLRARGDYLAGRTSVEEFEVEIDRLLRKEASFAPHAP